MKRLTVIAIALVVLVPVSAMAKGGWPRSQPVFVSAGLTIPSSPLLSTHQILGGCGSKRYRDPETHKCRGPADFGN